MERIKTITEKYNNVINTKSIFCLKFSVSATLIQILMINMIK